MLPKLPNKPKPAPSTSVLSFDHDLDTNTLTVIFHGGRTYRYDHVSPALVAKLRAAPSKGAFLNEHVIPHHTFTKIKDVRT